MIAAPAAERPPNGRPTPAQPAVSLPAATVTFEPAELDLFANASHDRNPLHMDAGYARKTAYGERVVFGVLAVLKAFGLLPPRPNAELSAIRLEFRNALHPGVTYQLEHTEDGDAIRLRLLDAERLLASVTASFRGAAASLGAGESRPFTPRTEAAERQLDALCEGLTVEGSYAPSPDGLAQLIGRLGLQDRGIAPGQMAALLWSSYLVGMEVPGKHGLFWSLDMQFAPSANCQGRSLDYRATIGRSAPSLEYMELRGDLACGGQALAQARLRAFVRRESPRANLGRLLDLLPASAALMGKRAVVVGGSRGLGAALVQALATQGCTVRAVYAHSTDEAERVRAAASEAGGCVEMVQGDASDATWYEDFAARQAASEPDILICNASPPIRPLGFSVANMARFADFVQTSQALVSVPLAASAQALAERGGWAVVISSAYVETLPAEWPHYVSAKYATEGLVHWAAARFPGAAFLLARPPKLETDQTNTPAARVGAAAVEDVAAKIVRRLCRPRPDAGIAEVMNAA